MYRQLGSTVVHGALDHTLCTRDSGARSEGKIEGRGLDEEVSGGCVARRESKDSGRVGNSNLESEAFRSCWDREH